MAQKDADVLRVAMVGAGKMAMRVHYPSLATLPDVRIEGVCDIDEQRMRAAAERYQIPRQYTDYKDMVDDVDPDAIYVIGQPHIMYDIWVWCLKHGLNLFVEKPLGLTVHQARALSYLAEKHGCITQVGFQRRSCPLLVSLHQKCVERGPIVHATCTFYKCATEPFLGARDHVLDDTVHAIDTLRWLCGGEIVSMDSAVKRVGVPDTNFVTATLHFDTGATGILINSWTSGRRIFRVEMHAPEISAEGDPEDGGTLYADGDTKGIRITTQEAANSSEFHVYGGFRAKHREFIDAIKAGTQPGSCFSDALRTMEAAASILATDTLRGMNLSS